MSNITLILADDMAKGQEVMDHFKLDSDNCAVLTNADYLDHVSLIKGETIYGHSNSNNELLINFVSKLDEMPKDSNITFKLLRT